MNFIKLSKPKISGFKIFRIKMPHLKIGDSVARIPIVQGGMGLGISLAGLASAVANQGGIGVIAANSIGMMEPDYHSNSKEAGKRALRKQIVRAKEKTDGIIGVNIMVAMHDFHDFLQVSIEEKVDMVFLGAGLPLKGIPVDELRKASVKVVPIVSSARAAKLIFSYWQKNYFTVPDAVVVEGPKAGGHLGFKDNQIDDPAYALEKLIPAVVKEIKIFEGQFQKSIPVIAAGGIFDGEDIYKFVKLGAGGVQMATRFAATEECDANRKFKEAFVSCQKDDVTIIKSPVGMPGRAIKNSFLASVEDGSRKMSQCPMRCLESCRAGHAKYCITRALNNARLGNLDDGFVFAGSNAYKVKEIVTVKSLINDLEKKYLKMVKPGTVNLRHEFNEAVKSLEESRNRYIKTAKKSIKSLKSDLGDLVDKGAAAFQDEYRHVLARLDSLKNDYACHFERVNELREQLARFFDTSTLTIPAI